ncbi:MAG: hypothetical protein QXV21_05420 [Candidatus Bathyarchaeia archaeon]
MVKKVVMGLFVLFVLFSWFVNTCFAVGQAEADLALEEAEKDLSSAYVSVAEADGAGANVSELLVRLELAGTLLAEANNAYRVGDYERAYSLAVNCSDAVNGVVSDALSLKSEAEEAYNQGLFFNACVSSVGLSLLFVLSLFGWMFLRKKYFRRILEMKPEVEDAAE